MLQRFIEMKQRGEKIAALTAYDATAARLLAAAGVELILVGDSLGMVIKGERDTLNVRLSEVAYHVRAVSAGVATATAAAATAAITATAARPPLFPTFGKSTAAPAATAPAASAAPNAAPANTAAPLAPLIVGDMPFASFQKSPQSAFANAAKLLAAGADMVKIEGGEIMAETVAFLTARGVPVCAHVGLMPQQVRASGGYHVQGRGKAADAVLADAQAMQAAGAALIVLELLPQALAQKITRALTIPTIGIGSGAACDGQILVLFDMLGMSGRRLKMAPDFLAAQAAHGAHGAHGAPGAPGSVSGALAAYVRAVKDGSFPAAAHTVA